PAALFETPSGRLELLALFSVLLAHIPKVRRTTPDLRSIGPFWDCIVKMTNVATATLALQYTPPNAAVNSGNVMYPVAASYNAQNVGQFDILSTEVAPLTNSIPFGSVTQCLMLVVKNGQATDIGLKINGGAQLAGTAAVISFAGGINTISGLSGMTSALVGQTVTIAGATTPANNGTFTIATVVNPSTITVANASGATDANNGHILWFLNMLIDNFKIPPGGFMAFAAPQAPGVPSGTPPQSVIASASVTSYAVPAVGNVEQIAYFVFGN
ncbi:MAG: hypothetical protein ACRD6W_03835, partial [Nitrososphaerales archaeon]